MNSNPRLRNLAILASVPASTTRFVMTLCAWKLYKGAIVLRPDAVDVVVEANEVTVVVVEYPSDRFDSVRDKSASVP
jgi:hypothetical protein